MQQPETPTVEKLFSNRVQFEIPVYQRAYVWSEDENWAPMWQDIVETVGRLAADPDGGERLKHFLGPIVLHQQTNAVGGVERRTVVDGQQRLTTLQLLLAATRTVALEHDCGETADDLLPLLENRGRGSDGTARQKILPSRRDREQFMLAIGSESYDIETTPAAGPLAAFAFFLGSIRDWLSDPEVPIPTDTTTRLTLLQDAIKELLFVVAINLDGDDNPQIIFETLNARGTALGALDLVKNAVFAEAERRRAPTIELHDALWEPTFESGGYWPEVLRQGRGTRPRSDWFLMHWLAAELGTVVRADRLYETFRREVLLKPDVDISELIERLCRDAQLMRSFDDLPRATSEGRFFARLRSMDTTTMLPVALLLFRSAASGVISVAQRDRALAALESWLVRRSILRLTSQGYNRILATILAAAIANPANADQAVIDTLRSASGRSAVWPGDDEVRWRLASQPLYNYLGAPRLRMLLEACELDLRSSRHAEDISLPEDLSVEHVLPQSWSENWPLPQEPDRGPAREEAVANRESHLHLLGNLTLVTQPLNTHLSNAAWTSVGDTPSKRRALNNHSLLLLNREFADVEDWTEATITVRGRALTDRIMRLWPGPDSREWEPQQ